MTSPATDLEPVRLALQKMSRSSLLIIAERAVELMPPAQRKTLLGDFLDTHAITPATATTRSLLDEVRDFHARRLAGEYYEGFDVNSRNCTERSKGTDAFMATFDRLVAACIRDTEIGPRLPTLQAFDLLFDVLGHIDEGHDDVIFFADEGGSDEVGVNWRSAMVAYFRCLAETASAEEFALAVDEVITDFADHDRAHYLAEACRLASEAQRAAVGALPAARCR
jgi:hypothetical protein